MGSILRRVSLSLCLTTMGRSIGSGRTTDNGSDPPDIRHALIAQTTADENVLSGS